jgi:cephalosporin-C deacetylase-like acetyl esterase
MHRLKHLFLAAGLAGVFLPLSSSTATTLADVPAPAVSRIATVEVRIAPERPGWTYAVGEPVRFLVSVTADKHPVVGAVVKYRVGLEGMPTEEKSATFTGEPLVIEAGSLAEPGFIRCVATAEVNGRTWRGVAAAGVEPTGIRPTQVEPADFDAFWSAAKAELAQLPIEPLVTLLPDSCTDKVDVYHVSLRVVGQSWSGPARIHGIYARPKAPGRYPAVLHVPGAGVRPYRGDTELAARGAITLEIGIHGIPVNLPQHVYDQLQAGPLNGYWGFNADDRDRHYYRRVILGCLRAVDFLATQEIWNGSDVIVTGGSQGGALAMMTAALDPRITGLAAIHPALCDVTGDLHGRSGGWPRPFQKNDAGEAPGATPAKIATSAYYDVVNFAKRLAVPGFYTWGYADEVCAPTSMYAAFNVIPAPRELALQLEVGHSYPPTQHQAIVGWIAGRLGLP